MGQAMRADTSSETPEARAQELLHAYLREARGIGPWPWSRVPVSLPAVQEALHAEPAVRVAIVREGVAIALGKGATTLRGMEAAQRVPSLLSHLFRREQAYSEADIRALLGLLIDAAQAGFSGHVGFGNFASPKILLDVVKQVERYATAHGLTDGARDELRRLRAPLAKPDRLASADQRRALEVVDGLLNLRDEESDLIVPGDDWGHAARSLLDAMDGDARVDWLPVLRHAATADGAKPSQKWLAEGKRLVEAAGTARFTAHAVAWLDLMGLPSRNVEYVVPGGWPVTSALVAERNAGLLRGLAWLCALVDDAEVARALGDAAVNCFKKLSGIGARCTKGGNACVWALGTMPGLHAVTQLKRLESRVQYREAQRLIAVALESAAARAGMSRHDLDDLAVPTFGLDDGRVRRSFGEFTAELAVTGARTVEIRWYGPDGLPRPNEPAAVKRGQATALKELKRTAEELATTLSVERGRLERTYLAEREWSFAGWKQRLLDHPLLSFLVRRLIWSFEDNGAAQDAAWYDGALIGLDDRPVTPSAEARVRLWHPIAAPAETVLAWREWLVAHGVTQPFKQAHREVYLLTDAERGTETYSNRFAAHILRQHQFAALCRERNWSYRLQGPFDNGGELPTLALPQQDLRVEFWVEAVEDGDEGRMSGAGIFLLVATDQVRFRRGATPRALTPRQWLRQAIRTGDLLAGMQTQDDTVPLADVPPLVFSEVMRDVDLFVGVCSVGADPTWVENGLPDHRAYWQDYAFGDLSASAQTRRAVLARLLPRLAIGDRCRLADRFLVVRGDRRTYKIHLGSANILMEPNDQYLCIVPGRNEGRHGDGTPFLPFEGDAILSVILSKAFLLADDTAITDPTITRQIGV
jgi:hypothetical protein